MAVVPRDAAGAQVFPNYDIVLPAELREEEIAGYLGDIYHEAATPQRPDVFRVE